MKGQQAHIDFGVNVVLTERFRRCWKSLSTRARQIVKAKIALLTANQRHPSLNVHRVRRPGWVIWECYMSATLRLLYQRKEGKLWLWDVGGHAVVERAYFRNFSLTEN